MSVHQHHKHAPASIICAVATVSDTRTVETDTSGALLKTLLTEAGHVVMSHVIIPDEAAKISEWVRVNAADASVQAAIITGGTGISPRDVTFEAVAPLLEKTIPGYGELFRMLSYEDIGAAAMLSRAIAGLTSGTVIIATPGSRGAVRLAMEKLILPELGHLVAEATKKPGKPA